MRLEAGPVNPAARSLAWLAAASAVLLALLVGGSLLATGRVDGFDAAILVQLRAASGGHGAAIALARGVTAFGNDVTLWIVTILTAGFLASAAAPRVAVRLCATAAIGGLLTTVVKAIVGRPRPGLVEHLVAVHPPSFPSGHAANSAFVYGTLMLVAADRTSIGAARVYLAVVGTVVVLAIGTSRVVLGVHWPSDVLAGWAQGATWALVAHRLFARYDGSGGVRARK